MKKVLFILFLMLPAGLAAQDSLEEKSGKFTAGGYLKELAYLTLDEINQEEYITSILHHRLNMQWMPNERFSASVSFRNRLIWGDEVRLIPGYVALLRNKNEGLDLQKAWISGKSMVLHTSVERLNVEYTGTRWNFRLGRQRINWGMTTTWNPNDIFNTYNFLDVDYEERPGNDGARIQYFSGGNSNVEWAIAYNHFKDKPVTAIKYTFNRWKYDFQFIGGWYFDRPSLGMGWAGNIRNLGFKGEAQFFFNKNNSPSNLNLSMEWNYLTDNNWFFNLGILFNKQGKYKPIQNWAEIDLNLSAENLMPTRYNVIGTVSREFTPLFSGNAGILFAPGTNLLILLPSLRYSLANNLDADLVWQSFFVEDQNRFSSMSHVAFVRLKLSY